MTTVDGVTTMIGLYSQKFRFDVDPCALFGLTSCIVCFQRQVCEKSEDIPKQHGTDNNMEQTTTWNRQQHGTDNMQQTTFSMYTWHTLQISSSTKTFPQPNSTSAKSHVCWPLGVDTLVQ